MPVIKPRDSEERVVRSFRLKTSLDNKLNEIAEDIGDTKTYVLESLLEYAINKYEKEKGGVKIKSK